MAPTPATAMTLPQGNLVARVVAIAAAAGGALWLFFQAGEVGLEVMALGGIGAALAAELFMGRHVLDLGVDRDTLLIARRRAWQPRFRGVCQRIPRADITDVTIDASEQPNAKGPPTTRYRVRIDRQSGEPCFVSPRPERRFERAETLRQQVQSLLAADGPA